MRQAPATRIDQVPRSLPWCSFALNPVHVSRPAPLVLSTLAHEMAHLWQHHFGKPSRTGYHNREWAAKMMEIGLMPTDTAAPGGKTTGQRVTHFIMPAGPFALACAALLAAGEHAFFHDRAGERDTAVRRKKAASKTRYTCPACGTNAWAKPAVHLVCGDCDQQMECAEAEIGELALAA